MTEKTPKSAEEKKPEPARVVARIPVQIVEERGESALVQWIEEDGIGGEANVRRGYIPLALAKEGGVSEDALAASAPYGVDWTRAFKDISLSSELIDQTLRLHGVFTLEDLSRGTLLVGRILYGLCDVADTIRAVKAKE